MNREQDPANDARHSGFPSVPEPAPAAPPTPAKTKGPGGWLILGVAIFAIVLISVLRTREPVVPVYEDYQEAVTAARGQNRPLLLLFVEPGIPNCERIKGEILMNEALQSSLARFVVAWLNVKEEPLAAERYDVTDVPLAVALWPESTETSRTGGIISPERLQAILDEVHAQAPTGAN